MCGGGFTFDEAAVLLEEAGASLLGPLALNCAAPDEGNLHLLDRVATPRQRSQYLVPLTNGDMRSCFAMSEPARCRLRPVGAPDLSRAGTGRLAHQRSQTIHHRRGRGGVRDSDGRWQERRGIGCDDVSQSTLPSRQPRPGASGGRRDRMTTITLTASACGRNSSDKGRGGSADKASSHRRCDRDSGRGSGQLPHGQRLDRLRPCPAAAF